MTERRFFENGCYGVKYGKLSLSDIILFLLQNEKTECDKAVSRSQKEEGSNLVAVTVKRAESALFVIFGTDKLYEGTASVPKIKRLGKVTLRLKAKKYLPP